MSRNRRFHGHCRVLSRRTDPRAEVMSTHLSSLLHWYRSPGRRHACRDRPSSLCPCPCRQGSENGRGRGGHNRDHDDHPSSANSHHAHLGEAEKVCDRHVGESDRDDLDHGHAQSRSATTQKGECEPTMTCKVRTHLKSKRLWEYEPQSSEYRRDQYACCASHGRRRLHRADSRIPQRQTYLPC